MPATTTSLKYLYRSMVLIREAEDTLLRLSGTGGRDGQKNKIHRIPG